jgi:hypothetical protein
VLPGHDDAEGLVDDGPRRKRRPQLIDEQHMGRQPQSQGQRSRGIFGEILCAPCFRRAKGRGRARIQINGPDGPAFCGQRQRQARPDSMGRRPLLELGPSRLDTSVLHARGVFNADRMAVAHGVQARPVI